MHSRMNHPRICGGCGLEVVELLNGDIWVPEAGMIPLCDLCIKTIITALPVLKLSIKLKVAHQTTQRTEWQALPGMKQLPARKFVLLSRPKEKDNGSLP